MKKIFDISVMLGEENLTYPGDEPFKLSYALSLDKGDFCTLSGVKINLHTGTHLDVQSHFIKGGKCIEDYELERFILPAVVIDVKGSEPISAAVLNNIDIKKGDAVLFRTENSTTGKCFSGEYTFDYVYPGKEVIEECIKKEVGLIGIDYATIENPNNSDFEIHNMILENDILILESINLIDVPEGRYILNSLPLKIKGGEASPVRAVLMKN